MLDDLEPRLGCEKSRDLLRRLEDKRVEQALPAEMELALLWAIANLGDLDIEPEWWGDARRPDAYTEALFPDRPSAIEIAAPSDNGISGEEAMDRVALEISDCADRVQKGSGKRLYYRFRDESGYEDGEYYRRRLAPPEYRLTPEAESAVTSWIASGASDRERLEIVEPGLHVEVERTPHQQTRYHNTWCSMPPETHSIDDNPLFELLKRKLKQLKAAHPETLRLIFLADVGSTLLNRLGTVGEVDPTRRRVSGREIISQFVTRYRDRIDGVVVFAPRRDRSYMGQDALRWEVTVFPRDAEFAIASEGLERIAAALPKPRFEGYQARSLFRQGLYSPAGRGWYLGITIEGRMQDELRVKVPARAVLDLLAGRITEKQFQHSLGQRAGDNNIFQHWLNMGKTLSGASMAPRDIDEDDDHLILVFRDDPAARPLRLGSDATDA